MVKKILGLCLIAASLFGGYERYKAWRNEPWVTEEAVAFLDEFMANNPNAKVLEFGSGASTLWFAQRTPNLVSIEHNQKYYMMNQEILKDDQYNKVDYRCVKRPYYTVCKTLKDESFDLILVDGRNRKGCIAHSIAKLKPGGVMMLDNSERKYYFAVFPRMKGWEHVSTEQKGPDKFDFWYRGWKTDWWIKP